MGVWEPSPEPIFGAFPHAWHGISPNRASPGGPWEGSKGPVLGPKMGPIPGAQITLTPVWEPKSLLKKGLPGGPWEPQNRPILGPILRAKSFVCPHVYKVHFSHMGPQTGLQIGPFGGYIEQPMGPKSH